MTRPHPAIQAAYTRQAIDLAALKRAVLAAEHIAGREGLFDGDAAGDALVAAARELFGDDLAALAADVQHEIDQRHAPFARDMGEAA